ncbi:MAG: DNA-binding protein WhiA [Gracilibacteraceae bacterium]|jgi:DNA-binding protein WhiA|nr:DNA-binding protein WhiA [Gracilibacteraceae bacterium]
MSFSGTAKDELARLREEKPCCRLAEIAALIRLDGTLQFGGRENWAIQVVTENAAVARKLFNLARAELERPADVTIRRKMRLRKNMSYLVRVYPKDRRDLTRLGILSEKGEWQTGVNRALIRSRCDKKAYLRGAFLAGGSVNNPERDYHLEIITNNLPLAKDLQTILRGFRLKAKISARKNSYVVYIKESEHIFEFLALVGAHQALFAFEDARILKGMRNQVNRLTNCETANLDKTVSAAVRQAENIRRIAGRGELALLPAGLREIAELRLARPECTLKELGEMLTPPVGKSGVNHRLRRIEEIANGLARKGGKNVSGD